MIHKKRILILLAVGITLFSSFLLNNQFWVNLVAENIEITENDKSNLKFAKYWPNLNRIYIDDTNTAIDWATTAANNDWCNGSGTWSDPYIIKNVIIDGQEQDSCILIENSNVFFRIENCTVFNTGDEGIYSEEPGIKIVNTNHGTFLGNNCSLNNYGIRLLNSDNNTFSNNIITKNEFMGITLEDSSNNTFKGNEISFSGKDIYEFNHGIDLSSMSNYNNISQNNIHNNAGSGIMLAMGNNNTISNNDIFNNNVYGIILEYGSDNTISKNTMRKCGIGIIPFPEISTNTIDTLNTVNGKPVYFYFNQTGLDKLDFLTDGPAGQIMLVKCNNSKISNFNLSQTSVGLFLSECLNFTISNNFANNCTRSGFFLGMCNNITLYNNSLNYNMNGMEVSTCRNNTIKNNNATYNEIDGINLNGMSDFNIIQGNNASNNIETGIYIDDCINNNITENYACNNNRAGIIITSSRFNIIKNNTADNNINVYTLNFGLGIQIGDVFGDEGCNNNTITENIISNNSYAGLFLSGKNNTITKNNFTNCGLIFGYSSGETTIDDFSSQTIDKSNLVNNKILYYYFNVTNLNTDNFSNAGQVVLVRCNDSLISNLQLDRASLGISSYFGSNITIYKNYLTENTFSGIYLIQNSNSNITENQLNINVNQYLEISSIIGYGFGIYLEDCHNCNFTLNIINDNGYGIYLRDSDNILLKNNTLYDNDMAGIYVLANQPGKCDNLNFTANKMRNCGLHLAESPYLQNSKLHIDKTNLVNGKPLYYYSNNNSLNSNNFIDPGQIILLNCNNSVISNVILSRCTVGISLFYCDNASVYNIDSSKNSFYGIMLVVSTNCRVYNNSASQNIFGIYSVFCSNNIYSENIVKNSKPIIMSNMYYGGGINCMWNNNNLTIVGNTLENCSNGIMIYSQSPAYYFNITENLINNNIQYGIWLLNCYNSTFTKNIIQNNGIGVCLDEESNNCYNTIWYNHFIGNELNAKDDGDNNRWDDGFAGNYWEDYDGMDANNDGIGDTPNSIRGLAYNSDNKPLLYPIDIDTDGEGLLNYEEYVLGRDNYRTNVTNPDSDYDELNDFWEWKNSTNPLKWDTDTDKMPDGWEVFNFLNPLNRHDNITDPDTDFLLNVYEYLNGTNPNNADTDGDNFLDGIELGVPEEYNFWTDPLNKWWYPMPNLAVVAFKATSTAIEKPFVLNITITNNGIWNVEDITVIIWVEFLGRALYNSTIDSDDPINLDVNEVFQDLIQSAELYQGGTLVMELQLDPENLINETYSEKDGSYRYRGGEDDNTLETTLEIVEEGEGSPGNGGIDPLIIILIVIGAAAFAGIVSTYTIVRPRIKRRAIFKKQIENAKRDMENFEFNIRSFIKTKLTNTYESAWWDKGIPEYIRRTIGTKLKVEKPKKLAIQTDEMNLLDFTHYGSIITYQENWEKIFSKTFPNKSEIETDFENLRLIKRDLNEGTITHEQLSSYPFYIHAIRNYFTKGFNVFLSYSTQDTEYYNIKEIAKRLETYPEIDRVFFWEEDSGENIVTYMERTLKMTKAFVFFCTEKSIRSKAVEDEWQAAFQMRKKGLLKIVPVYEKEDLIPFLLTPLLNVKFTKDDFDSFIQKLYEEIVR